MKTKEQILRRKIFILNLISWFAKVILLMSLLFAFLVMCQLIYLEIKDHL
jgi:hypothetical protein